MQFFIDSKDLVVDEYEALRYLGYKRNLITKEDISLVEKYIERARPVLNCRACYERFPVSILDNNKIVMPYGEIESESLSINLKGASEIYIFAATIGAAFDRMMHIARAKSMSEAAILQAVGAASVEAVCNSLNKFLEEKAKEEGESLHPRFSPGFGDLFLENQKGVFSVLNPYKFTGITLNDSLIMSPEKSVTAIIGIERR